MCIRFAGTPSILSWGIKSIIDNRKDQYDPYRARSPALSFTISLQPTIFFIT